MHDRLACQVAATQRAQQAAAALQRSVAVSRQIATLQARALLGAASAMQVRQPPLGVFNLLHMENSQYLKTWGCCHFPGALIVKVLLTHA